MDDEQMIHDIVNVQQKKVEGFEGADGRPKGIYGDVDPRLQTWPKYTDSIKQREP